MSTPFFSVVIPSYNREHLIAALLKSLQAQTFYDFEAIIVDDGGTDNTKSIVESFQDKRFKYVYKVNGERAAARNFGAAMATGRYVNFFDSDDLAYANHLSAAASLAAKHQEPEIFHFGYDVVSPGMKLLKKHNSFDGRVEAYAVKQKELSINAIFLRRDITRLIPFSENRDLSASEDALWLCQLAARYTLYYSNEVTTAIIDHENRSMTTASLDQIEKRKELLIAGLKNDTIFCKKYGHLIPYINAEMEYLMCISAFAKKEKKKGLKFFASSVRQNPGSFFTRRIGFVMKQLLR